MTRTGKDLLQEATSLYKEGDYVAARQAYQAAVAIEPEQASWHAALGACYLRLNAAEDAASAYTEAIALNPHEGKFHAGLAQSALRSGDLETARSAFADAIRLKPDVAPGMQVSVHA